MLLTRPASSQRSAGARRMPLRARLSAVFLVLLIALPFTAPFSTCDLATLLAAPAPHPTEHSLGSSTVRATGITTVMVTMDEEKHVCELEARQATVGHVTTVAAVDVRPPANVVVRSSSLPLRL